MRAIAREYPDAVVGEPSRAGTMAVHADDDPALTPAKRRRIMRDRYRALDEASGG